MVRRVVRFALRQRLLILGATLLLIALGVRSFLLLPVEAFPDVEDVHVTVISQWSGHAAEEMERTVTLPIERELNGLPNLMNMRSVSMFGLSMVTLTFEDGTTDYFARQQTLEKLQGANLPNGVQPGLAALSNSVGEIYRYTLSGPLPVTELRSLEDWVVEPAYRTVPGVADVNGFGGIAKQYQVDVDPQRMASFGVTLPMVEQAVAAANANAGGGFLEHGYEKQVVRGVGRFRSLDDIADVAIVTRHGVPVRVRDVGEVHTGGAEREGVVAKDSSDDVVEGIVLMRKGLNAMEVLQGVRTMTAELNSARLPNGVRVVPFYDRATLVGETVRTVEENLAIGATLVMLVLVVFLGDWTSALIVGMVIPLSLLGGFILMQIGGVSANLISLGAVDFGIIVDSAVVLVEALLVQFAREGADGDLEKRELIANVGEKMGRPILFAKAILITAFLPIFTFQRVEKRIFSPMAFTLTFALLGSLLLSLTLVPVLSALWLRVRRRTRALTPLDGAPAPEVAVSSPEQDPHGPETPATRWLRGRFEPLLDAALRRRRVLLTTAIVALIASFALASQLGSEFLPGLDEGNIWLTIEMPTGISLTQAKLIEREVRGIVRSYPEVKMVLTQLGRPDDGTDAKGSNNLEVYAALQSRGTWKRFHHDGEALVADMNRRLSGIPGLELNFSQYIKDNVNEALSGVKGDLVVKIFGPELETLQHKAEQTLGVMQGIRGVSDLGLQQQFGQPQLRLELDRAELARQGVSVADAEDAIETAVGGRAVTRFLEGDAVYDVRIRAVAAARSNRSALERLAVPTADGRTVPLASLAHFVAGEGASRIAREANERRIAIKCSVRGRDEGGFVAEAQRKVAAAVALPPGYRMTWGGQFENQRRATTRLLLIVPASIVLIFILLFSAFGSARYAALILVNIPFALIGGIVMLYLRHIHLSVSAAVGFIVLFGIAVQNGVLLVSEFNSLRERGRTVKQAVREGTLSRLRPVVMTALMAALGLLPAAFSTRMGAETTRPFASVIVGGMMTATLLTLLLLPVLYQMFHEEPHAEIAR